MRIFLQCASKVKTNKIQTVKFHRKVSIHKAYLVLYGNIPHSKHHYSWFDAISSIVIDKSYAKLKNKALYPEKLKTLVLLQQRVTCNISFQK